MKTTRTRKPYSPKRSWYSERGTTTSPSSVPGMVTLSRNGKFIALVPEKTA